MAVNSFDTHHDHQFIQSTSTCFFAFCPSLLVDPTTVSTRQPLSMSSWSVLQYPEIITFPRLVVSVMPDGQLPMTLVILPIKMFES